MSRRCALSMNSCIICYGPCQGPRLPSCGHVHCDSCYARSVLKSDSTLQPDPSLESASHCLWKGCGRRTPLSQVKLLPAYRKLPGDHEPSPSGRKFMDDEIEALAHKMDRKSNRDAGRSAPKRRRTTCEENQEDSGDCSLGPQGDFSEYSLDPQDELYSTPQPPLQGPLDDPSTEEDDRIVDLLIDLSKIVKDCTEISGFYENSKGDKIIIDIATGSKETVREFLNKTLKSGDVTKEPLGFVEQPQQSHFLVATGAKVANKLRFAPERQAQLENSHPDELRETDRMGTVSCLGRDRARGQLYILTAKHVFDCAPTTHATGAFLSAFHSRLQAVSGEYHGVLGSVPVDDPLIQHGLVDIAALPLTHEVQEGLEQRNPNLLHDLKDIYSQAGALMRKDLKNRTVYKHGAVTGTTVGRVLIPCYHHEVHDDAQAQRYSGKCFVIEAEDPGTAFAEEGDSGALVWDKRGVPIGLVSFHRQQVLDDGTVRRATFAVRLDYCLQALRMRTPVDIVECRAAGSPIPVTLRPNSQMYSTRP